MIHLTLNTGHARQSPRSEVRDDVIAQLRAMVRAGGGEIPGPTPGYRVAIAREGRDALFTVCRAECPVLTCVLAVDDGPTVWSALTALLPAGGGDAGMPRALPWLAVVLQELSRPDDLHWLADFERCLAWALLEDGAGA